MNEVNMEVEGEGRRCEVIYHNRTVAFTVATPPPPHCRESDGEPRTGSLSPACYGTPCRVVLSWGACRPGYDISIWVGGPQTL